MIRSLRRAENLSGMVEDGESKNEGENLIASICEHHVDMWNASNLHVVLPKQHSDAHLIALLNPFRLCCQLIIAILNSSWDPANATSSLAHESNFVT